MTKCKKNKVNKARVESAQAREKSKRAALFFNICGYDWHPLLIHPKENYYFRSSVMLFHTSILISYFHWHLTIDSCNIPNQSFQILKDHQFGSSSPY